jgi:actin-like ATPase involved in cell morphogenesis
MGYALGLDVGTTYTAAAVARGRDRPEVVQLGARAAAVPTVVYVDEATVLTGDAAVRRALSEPHRVAREFKRRVGDPAPILLGGAPFSAEMLFARVLRWTVDAVVEREGSTPDRIAVCHPANWGPYKHELLRQACRIAELDDVETLSEPEAAAIHYAALEHVEVGALVAVYDLGGGTFDAAVLRKTAGGFEIIGTPEGIERLGGIDFDEAIVAHVREAMGDRLADLDLEDHATVAALARLRQECIEAKEALSADVETSIPVVLPGLHTEVRLTRAELESMVRVPLLETIAALRRALRSASVQPEELTAVLLVGGSSRMPLVAELVGQEIRRPVAVDADPKQAVALGAARAAAAHAQAASVPVDAPAVVPSPAPAPAVVDPGAQIEEDEPPARDRPPARPAEAGGSPPRRRRVRYVLLGTAVTAAVLIAVIAMALGGSERWISACPPEDESAACITSVSFDEGDLVAEFATQEVDAAQSRLGQALGTVFFLASISEGEAEPTLARGRTDAWLPWGLESPFTGTDGAGRRGFAADEVTGDAAALCVLLGDSQGRVAAGSGNCAQLPPRP